MRATAVGALALAFVLAAGPLQALAAPRDVEPDQVSLLLHAGPSAAIARSPPGDVDRGTLVTLSAAASVSQDGGFSDYVWDFGDGVQAEGLTVTHAYKRSGVFIVNLAVHDIQGAASIAFETVAVLGPDLWPARERVSPDAKVNSTYAGETNTMTAVVTLPWDPDHSSRRANATFPSILQYSPYGGGSPAEDTIEFLMIRSGYAWVRVAPPGRANNPGTWDFFGPRDRQGGHDAVEWIARQPWSNGLVGMHGASAPGIEALLTASARPPHLAAVVTNAAYGDPYRDLVYPGGLLNSDTFVNAWFATNLQVPDAKAGRFHRVPETFGAQTKILQHPTFDGYWRERSIVDYPPPTAPVLAFTQTHDLWPRSSFELFNWVRPAGGRVVVCPGGHGCVDTTGYEPAFTNVGGFTTAHGEIRSWFDHYLKGVRNGVEAHPPLLVLSTSGGDGAMAGFNAGRWNAFDAYPPREVQWQDWHLRAAPGSLPTFHSLLRAPPESLEVPDLLAASPASGASTSASTGFVYAAPTFGTQAVEEAQSLVYETPPFTTPMHIVGPLALRLFAMPLGPDMAWVARLDDVWADGSANFLTEGYLKASHRALDPDRTLVNAAGDVVRPYHPHDAAPGANLLTPGSVYEFEIELWPVANRVLPGHQLRLTLSAQSAVWHVNAEPGPAVLILHDAGHPTRLLMPVLGEGEAPAPFPYASMDHHPSRGR